MPDPLPAAPATVAAPAASLNLDDPAAYVTVPLVPVLDEHVMTDPKRGATVTVDAQILREIADQTNRRAREKNNPCPLTVGHTSDDPRAPERKVVGYAVNFQVRPFGPDPTRTALYADFKVRADHAAVVQDFPRRSVELWLDRREIDPIALLGGTTPERDLGDLGAGIIRYSRGGEAVYRFQMDAPAETEDEVTQMSRCEPKDEKKPGKPGDDKKPTKMAAAENPAAEPDGDEPTPAAPPATGDTSGDPMVEKVFADARWADQTKKTDEILDILHELVQGMGGAGMGGAPGGEPGAAPPAGGDDLMPDEEEGEDEPAGPPAKKPGPPDAEDRKSNEPGPVRLGAGAVPGATGGYIPDAVGKKEPTKMSRDDTALRQRIAELEEKIAHKERLEKATAVINGLADGTALAGERIKFARKEKEIDTLAAYMAVQESDTTGKTKIADEYVEGIKLNYQREAVAPADRTHLSPARYARTDLEPAADQPADATEAALVAETIMAARRQGQTLSQADALGKVRLSRKTAGVSAPAVA